MSFIIPDNILDTLTCNTCNKYLSVQPVKIYPNRRIKCGRCARSKKQGDGVISLFGLVADKCLFKCINRFDGCRELLTYSQVRDHEKICKSRVSRCTICSDSEEISTYFIVRHFREKHRQAVLDYPGFILNQSSSSEISELYMYVQEDNLFFITFKWSQSEGAVELNISYNGNTKEASDINQKFCIQSDNFEFHTKKKPCTSFEEDNLYSFCLEKSEIAGTGKALIVKFELEFANPKLLKLPLEIQQSTMNLEESVDTLSVESLIIDEGNITPSAPFVPTVDSSSLRAIYLSESFLTAFPDIYLSLCSTAIIQAKRIIFLQCFNCQQICWRGMSQDIVVQQFYICFTSRHSLCYFCFQYLKFEKKIKEDEYMTSSLPPKALKNIKFFCRYQCGLTFVGNDHMGHEESCHLQPYQDCPVQSCTFKGLLVEIASHFSQHSNLDCCFYTNLYFSALFNRNIYVWMGNHFVYVRIVSECSGLSIDMTIRKKSENSLPLALLFDDNKKFVLSFENSMTKNIGNHWLKIMLASH